MRDYQKKQSSVDLGEFEDETESEVLDESTHSKIEDYNYSLVKGRTYTKSDGERDPSIYRIICGGERREPDYYSIILKNKEDFQKLKVIIHESGDEPIPLFEKALEIKRDEGIKPELKDLSDRIFLVSDVDEFYSQLVEIKQKCEKEKIDLIISNSCIEVWHYYHYFSVKPNDFEVPSDISKISNSFKTYLNKKVKGGIKPTRDIFKITKAIENSKKNYGVDSNGIPLLFATNMFIIGEVLYDLIKDGLDAIEKRNIQKIMGVK